MDKIIKFNFDSWPMPLSGKIVIYICPKCKYKIEVPIEAVHKWEEEDIWNGLDKSIPPYGECTNSNQNKRQNKFCHTLPRGKVFLFH